VIYREAGQFKTSYASDQAIFPIVQDRVLVALVIVAAFLVPPLALGEYWLQAVLIPFLIYALAALGLNLLTGYAGQLSLGTGAFMAVGAYSAFKLTTAFPAIPIAAVFLFAGLMAALVGVVFGLPSLRIKGFYLAVATLAAQFFVIWLFNKVAWFVNYAPSGTITAPPRRLLGVMVTGPEATAATRYVVALAFVVVFAVIAKNLVRGRVGRSWMAIRDRDIAAEIIGVRPLRTKLLAFAISSSTSAARRRSPSTSTSRSWSCSWSSSAGWGACSAPFSAPRSSCSCPSFSPMPRTRSGWICRSPWPSSSS
jgi:branched-chain amino acid transport system permease protein